eukprot:193914_1
MSTPQHSPFTKDKRQQLFDEQYHQRFNNLRLTSHKDEQKTSHKEEDIIEDEYTDDLFPIYLNVALFHRSDDESLELLIDKSVLELFYGNKFKQLWTKHWFIQSIYSDKLNASGIYDNINIFYASGIFQSDIN